MVMPTLVMPTFFETKKYNSKSIRVVKKYKSITVTTSTVRD